MSESIPIDIPIACNLPDAALAERKEQITAELLTGILSTNELEDGYELLFPAEKAWIEKINDFILFERECCPFFTFEFLLPAARPHVALRLRGGEGVKTFTATLLAGSKE